jgi:tRNA (cytidine/uridine-2'-O-)-methyltransferase
LPFLSLALYEPEIPANAGNIARLCAATGTTLHLIGRLGFSFRHPDARRAGMDYWERVEVVRHLNYQAFSAAVGSSTVWAFTTKARRSLWDVPYARGDVLLFGPESRGLPDSLLATLSSTSVRIPMMPDSRSLNLSNAAGIALYEGLRQLEAGELPMGFG